MYIYICIRIDDLSIYVFVSVLMYPQQYLFTVEINKLQMCSSQFNLKRMFLSTPSSRTSLVVFSSSISWFM